MLKEQLIELGFTPNQAEVYLALLDLGLIKVGPLVRKTGFHRTIVYRALKDLIARKLVYKTIRQGIAYFQSIDPDSLLDEIEQRQELAQLVVKKIKIRQRITSCETAQLSGFSGIEYLTQNILEQGEDLYIIGENGACIKRYPDHFRAFHLQRATKHIYFHALALPHQNTPSGLKIPLSEMGFFPYPVASSLTMWVYGHTIALILWETNETITLIHNKKIADGFRDYFTLLRGRGEVSSQAGKRLKFL